MKKLIIFITPFLLALAIVVPSFPAGGEKTQVWDIAMDQVWTDNPCIGEDVHLTGTLHAVSTLVINKNTGHWIWQYNPKGLTGVGLDTGTVYHATGLTRQEFQWTEQPDLYPMNFTFVNRVPLISEGSGANLVWIQTVHATLNANGEVTADFNDDRFLCTGTKP
jgi:hypothetical protein